MSKAHHRPPRIPGDNANTDRMAQVLATRPEKLLEIGASVGRC